MAIPHLKNLDERYTRQLLQSRYYMELADQQGRIDQAPARFAAINMLHEAFETALLCFADALGCDSSSTSTIDKLIAGIEKVIGRTVPFRIKILRFNKIRVNAKHYNVEPTKEDVALYLSVVPEFIGELTDVVFRIRIDEVSLSNLIIDNVVREHVQIALSALAKGENFECLVACRRAMYVVFESQYDLANFLAAEGKPFSIIGFTKLCHAPLHTKSQDFIAKHVREPFDMIAIDNSHLEGELIKDGIDTHAFWNLLRLTPRVYQRSNGAWINAYSSTYARFDRAECAYVVDTLIGVLLQRQAKRGSSRTAKHSWDMIEVKPGSPFFDKASSNSPVKGYIPLDVTQVSIGDAVPSLEDDNWFYRFWHFGVAQSLSGYIERSAVVGKPFESPLR